VSKVTVKDQGWRAMLARAREIAGGRGVRVGILADEPKRSREPQDSGLSLVEVALIHEFGAPAAGIPQRSFLRAAIDEHAPDIRRLILAVAARALDGAITPAQALDQIGSKVAGWVQTRIDQGIAPPLKPETIARKGSSKPLVNVGQLKAAITWKVGE
jgi:hypothetical protein